MADPRGRPVALAITPGNLSDIGMAVPLLERLAAPSRFIADKAYDADSLRNWLRTRRVQAVVPSNATCYKPYPLDRRAYRQCNVVERLICRLKNWRRVATRYDRLASHYRSANALISYPLA